MKLNKNIRYEVAIHSPEHSEAVQKRLLELDEIIKILPKYFNKPFLFFGQGQHHLSYEDHSMTDLDPKYQVITLDQLYNIETPVTYETDSLKAELDNDGDWNIEIEGRDAFYLTNQDITELYKLQNQK